MAVEEEETGAQISGEWINNLRFADDAALLSETPNKLQTLTNNVVKYSTKMGMAINTEKTGIQSFGSEHKPFHIQILLKPTKPTKPTNL